MAYRLTTHLGTQSFPAISPDGSLVAFSAEYEGATEVRIARHLPSLVHSRRVRCT
jgi:Tol biopolymer transport system component